MSRPPQAAPVSRDRLGALLERMRDRRIVVVGDAMLDRYLVGEIERASPEAPVPVLRVIDRHHGAGGAANVAANLAAMGGRPRLVAVTGDDPAGGLLRAELGRLGLPDEWLLAVPGRPTTVKTRVMAGSGQLIRIDDEADHPVDGETLHRVGQAVLAALDGAEALVFEDYDKGLLQRPLIRAAMTAALDRAIPVVVDPKIRGFFEYQGATVLKPNGREVTAALGRPVDLDHADLLGELLARLEVRHLLLTLGARGMVLASSEGGRGPLHLPALPRPDADVSGAGDTVAAGLALALAAGASVLEAAWVGSLAASAEVAKPGVATVGPGEILRERERLGE